MDDVLEFIKNKPQAVESLGERSVLQVDGVIELVEVVSENFILEIGFLNRRRGGRGKFIFIGKLQHFYGNF